VTSRTDSTGLTLVPLARTGLLRPGGFFGRDVARVRRVSTTNRDLQLQLDALARAGVARKLTFTATVSEAKTVRPGRVRANAGAGRRPGGLAPGSSGLCLRHLIDLVADR